MSDRNTKEKRLKTALRIKRVKAVISKSGLPRLSVARGLKGISVQLIDDSTNATIAAAYDREVPKTGTKTERALAVGKLIAERVRAKGITAVVFDRRGMRYHGRIKALADGAREGGLKF
ncbi:MAG: 50S ribosomal protein L18 [bacterium]|nr:50S ribosomal protein L18 [bacterium]